MLELKNIRGQKIIPIPVLTKKFNTFVLDNFYQISVFYTVIFIICSNIFLTNQIDEKYSF